MTMPIASILLSAVLVLLPSTVSAQHPASIRGTVLDAAGGAPITGAAVTLVPREASGGFPPVAGSAAVVNARRTTTDSLGRYGFPGIAAGEYRLHVTRQGYEPASVDVLLAPSAAAQLSVGLEVRPVRLAAVRIDARAVGSASGAAGATQPGTARVAAALERQRRFLGGDVRELTHDDVTEAVTLGNGDVLRALQRLPGVTTYDEWSARAAVRGSRPDHTRFHFDGIPLFIPLQGLGTATAVQHAMIGSIFLHPGVRPVSLGGDGVSRIDLRSRPASGGGRLRASAEVGSNSGSLAAEQQVGRGGWVAGVRHSIGNGTPVLELLSEGGIEESDHAELIVRGDVPVRNSTLEVTGILARDGRRWPQALAGPVPTSLQWTTGGARATLRTRGDRYESLYSIMDVAFEAHREGRAPYHSPSAWDGVVPVTSTSALRVQTTEAEVATPTDSLGRRWAVGYGFTRQEGSWRGARATFVPGELSRAPETRRQELAVATVWGERRWLVGEKLQVETGLRINGFVDGLHGLTASPAVQVRYRATPATLVSAGAGRSLQLSQELPVVGRTAPIWYTAGTIVSSGGDIPPLVADHVSAGVERWLSEGVLLSAGLWGRRATGVLMPDPTPGELVNRPMYVTARERAIGLDVAARKLTGRITGMLAYGRTDARSRYGDLEFASSGARRHAFDATAMTSMRSWRVGTAWTAASGAPYARTIDGQVNAEGSEFITVPVIGEPNGLTMPWYSSHDVLVERRGRLGKAHVTSFLQVQNVLDRVNPMYFLNPADCRTASPGQNPYVCDAGSLLYAPVGRTFTFGFRFAF